MKKWIFIIMTLIFFACEDEVTIDLDEAPPAYVVDAWLNNQPVEQVIKLSWTQAYFDNSNFQRVEGATVVVTDSNGENLLFNETSPGEYTWDPNTSDVQIETFGTDYTLSVEVDNEVFISSSTLNRVPVVDSIVYTFEEEQSPFEPEGYYAQFFATDLPGVGDTYWIKSYRNGVLLNNPFDINIAFDAGFGPGGEIDGVVFIQPIQDAVTSVNEELDAFEPYQIGDSLYVEIHSISNEAFTFLEQVQIQTQRDGGFDEIFAEPLENVVTNIININPNTTTQVVGFFNVAAIEGEGRRLLE